MDAEQVFNLFDAYWFQQQIVNHRQLTSSCTEPIPEVDKPSSMEDHPPTPEVSQFPSLRGRRSMSEELITAKTSFVDDTGTTPTKGLQTIPSGKEIAAIDMDRHEQEQEQGEAAGALGGRPEPRPRPRPRPQRRTVAGRHKDVRSSSKSLSDLEFEELKGFMDLGFVFSEEDRNNSSLASIVPGIQRLGSNEEDQPDGFVDQQTTNGTVQRPYLSEAWEAAEMADSRREVENSELIKWEIPETSSEVDVKESLKWWAQTVASTVR